MAGAGARRSHGGRKRFGVDSSAEPASTRRCSREGADGPQHCLDHCWGGCRDLGPRYVACVARRRSAGSYARGDRRSVWPVEAPAQPLAFIDVINRCSFAAQVFALLFAAGLFLAVGQPVAAQGGASPSNPGLVIEADTEVVVNPEDESFQVVHRYRLVHQLGQPVTEYLTERIPSDAQGIRARINGRNASIAVLPGSDGLSDVSITLPRPLDDGDTLSVELSWQRMQMNGSANAFDRVSPALVAIAPFAVGHTEQSTLTVTVPAGRDVYLSDGYTAVDAGDQILYELNRSAVDTYVPTPLVLEDPSQLIPTVITELPRRVVLSTGSGADDWLGDDFSGLIALLGRWYPPTLMTNLEFREGYTGDQDIRRIDQGVFAISRPLSAPPTIAVLRAAAATWMEQLSFTDPLLRTEFAEAVADRVLASQGVSAPPRTGTWVTAMTALAAVSDSSTVVSVLNALEDGSPVFPGADDPPEQGSVDWRRFTDVYDRIAGIESAVAAMRLSASPSQTIELDQRRLVVDQYDLLAQRAAPWHLPVFLRQAITQWDFDAFSTQRDQVSELIRRRDEMITEASSVDLGIGTLVQERFENATDSLEEAAALLDEQREALDHVAKALRLDTGDRGLLSSLGMAGRSIDGQRAQLLRLWADGDYSTARDQADHLVEDFEASVGRGTVRLLIPLLLVAGLLFAGSWARRVVGARGPQRTDW